MSKKSSKRKKIWPKWKEIFPAGLYWLRVSFLLYKIFTCIEISRKQEVYPIWPIIGCNRRNLIKKNMILYLKLWSRKSQNLIFKIRWTCDTNLRVVIHTKRWIYSELKRVKDDLISLILYYWVALNWFMMVKC